MRYSEIAELVGLRIDPTSEAHIREGIPTEFASRVPQELISFWTQVSAHKPFISAFHRFWAAAQWRVVGDYLLFMQENQGVAFWGVLLGGDDPPVFRFENLGKSLGEATPEGVLLSAFLQAMTVMQLSESSLLPFVGYAQRPLGSMAPIFLGRRVTPLAPVGDLAPFAGSGVVATVTPGECGEEIVIIATPNEQTILEYGTLFGLGRDAFVL